MRNFYDGIANFAATKGLYRVWVRADDRDGAPLAARWIDPRVEKNVSRAEDRNFRVCEDVCLADESAEPEIDPALQLLVGGAF